MAAAIARILVTNLGRFCKDMQYADCLRDTIKLFRTFSPYSSPFLIYFFPLFLMASCLTILSSHMPEGDRVGRHGFRARRPGGPDKVQGVD